LGCEAILYVEYNVLYNIDMSGVITTGKLVLTDTNSNSDAFDRFRVSEPYTLFDYNSVFDKAPSKIEELVENGATSTHSNDSYISMAVTADTHRVIRQSKEYILYQPGKSKLAMFSGVMEISGGDTNLLCRIGSFDDHNDKSVDAGGNGHFFELDGTTLYVVERNSTNGTGQTDTRVDQTNWNIDVMDGTGVSEYTLDSSKISKAQIFVIDQEWLGVGRVRMGIVLNGVIRYVHHFTHETHTAPYTRTAKLPIRYEISKNGTTGSAGEMRMMCSTIQSEGGYIPLGNRFYGGQGAITKNVTTLEPLLSLRLSPAYNRMTMKISSVHIITTSGNDKLFWELRLNPVTLAPQSFTSQCIISGAEIDTSATSVVGGICVGSGYVSTKTSESFILSLQDIISSLPIVSNIAGTSDILTLAVTSIGGGSSTLAANVEWFEIV